MKSINGSVGRGGRNNRQDVVTVQQLLNLHNKPPNRPLSVDGIVGPKTITAIERFQREVLGVRRPDGRVDPGRRTISALSGGKADEKQARQIGPWHVPALTQTTPNICWEACARMMWQWRHKSLAGYTAKAGAYAHMNTGLTQAQMDKFYKQLGMRSLLNARGANLQHALKFTPVIFTDVNQTAGHAMVLTGYGSRGYTVVNPCAVQSIDFDSGSNTCAAGTSTRTRSQVERPLGSYIWYW